MCFPAQKNTDKRAPKGRAFDMYNPQIIKREQNRMSFHLRNHARERPAAAGPDRSRERAGAAVVGRPPIRAPLPVGAGKAPEENISPLNG